MNLIKRNFSIAILPLLLLAWGIFTYLLYDPFFSRTIDPEFPYLINGLNCATLKFNYIGHYDHPGTPFQVFNGIVIRLTHLVSGKGNIVQDVFARPEHYMNAISNSMLFVQVLLIFAVGFVGFKRKIPFWQIAILQASCFFNDVLIWFFNRANPDRFFMITFLIFILIYLKHGYENRSLRKFAIWSGVAMALGLATKINYLPLLILPLLYIDTNKNRLIYVGSCIVSFFIFIAPIINKFNDFFRFLTGIFKHDELYGGGQANILNVQKMMNSTVEIFKGNPELYVLIITLIAMAFIAFRKRKEGMNGFMLLFAGFLVIIVVQMLMVSKHYKNYYLAPTFIIYGFIFFSISLFLYKIMKRKIYLIIFSILLPVLFLYNTVHKVKRDYPVILNSILERNKIRTFVDTEISKTDYWFIEPTWESAPFVENALVYGLSYCGHRTDYLPQLMAVNPNIITYEGNTEQVKMWRGSPVNLDSIIATGKNINVYSTPDRHASILIGMVKVAAARNNIQLSVDTVFSDSVTKNEIIRIKSQSSSAIGQYDLIRTKNRQRKIEGFIQSIKNTPEWFKKVKEKAIQAKIPLDSMILLDAIWMTDNQK